MEKGKTDFRGIITEIVAKKLLLPPNDDYKRGHNDAIDKALETVRLYEKGDGLFQRGNKEIEGDLWEQAARELFFAHNPNVSRHTQNEVNLKIMNGFRKDMEILKLFFTITKKA